LFSDLKSGAQIALGDISLSATRWRFTKIAFSALPLMVNFRRKSRLFALFSLEKMDASCEWDDLKKFCFQIWNQDLLLDLAMWLAKIPLGIF
jgi:hypothetical protein